MAPPSPQSHFRCLRCGYSLAGLADPARVCPECGTAHPTPPAGRCPSCYSVLPHPIPTRCPECGADTDGPLTSPVSNRDRDRFWRWLMAAGGALVIDVMMIPAPTALLLSWVAFTLLACPSMFLMAALARRRAGEHRLRPWLWVLLGFLLATALGVVTVTINRLLGTMGWPLPF